MGIASTNATVTIGDQTMPLSDLMPGIYSSSSCAVSSLAVTHEFNREPGLVYTF